MTCEISKHWLVHPPSSESPISLRALKPAGSSLNLYPVNRTYHPKDYESLDALKAGFERDALSLNEHGYNIYTVMNRIRTDLLCNRAVKDDDIIERTKILIDIDRVGDTSIPATDAEVQASFDLAQVICGFLTSKDFPQPKWVHSGNGTHLYLDLEPCTSDVLDSMTVGRLLKGLAEQFNYVVCQLPSLVLLTYHHETRKRAYFLAPPFYIAPRCACSSPDTYGTESVRRLGQCKALSGFRASFEQISLQRSVLGPIWPLWGVPGGWGCREAILRPLGPMQQWLTFV